VNRAATPNRASSSTTSTSGRRITVVDMPGARHVAAQLFQLRADRPAFGLPLGRHARIQRHPHRGTPAKTAPAAPVVAASRRNW